MFALVLFGSLVPVIPTGTVVATTTVVALHDHDPAGLVLIFVLAALAAFLGDTLLYWLGARGARTDHGSRLMRRLTKRVAPEHVAEARKKLRKHTIPVLILSRLMPAGRIPVMVACLLAHMPLRRFMRGNAPACLAWAGLYQLIGIGGGALFPEPWEGVAAAIALTLLIAAAPSLWQRLTGWVRARTQG
ncbi:DedA family protein [Streptomyces polyrhachis]|uniref:DedA family protein n=1 Tax=Streptomyces polyrhachis TaxID=1282885 RepID=A0ABW2GPH1_9ACTN